MPLNHGQGNAGGEATGDNTSSSTRDSDSLQRKRKPEFEEAEISQGSQQGEQSYATFNSDDSDGEPTGLSSLEIQGYHLVKKLKATPAGLLSGTLMGELCVVPATMDSTAKSSAVLEDHQPRGSRFEPPSQSALARPVSHLVNDCIENVIRTNPKERRRIEGPAQADLLGHTSDETLEDTVDRSDNIAENSFVIVKSNKGRRSQLFPGHTEFSPPDPNHIPATRSQIIRPSPSLHKATDTNVVEAVKNMHERSTGAFSEGLATKSQDGDSADSYGSEKGVTHVAGTDGSTIPENQPQTPGDVRSKADDKDYEFVEHPEPHSIQRFRQIPAIVRDPSDGAEHPVLVNADNCSDSNFISSSIVQNCGFHQRPLVGKDIATYKCLAGACTPKMYVRLELKLRDVSEHYMESFRVVDNDDFELIVGAATIQGRRIPLQEQTARGAFIAFKKAPTKGETFPNSLRRTEAPLLMNPPPEQAAAQEASRKKDCKQALELSKNIPPYNNTPPATQRPGSAKDDPRNTSKPSARTPTSSKNRPKG